MNNRFKIRKLLRIVAIFGAVIFCCDFAVSLYKHFINELTSISFEDCLFYIVCSVGFVYCAMSFNKMEYEIKDESLIVKDFMKKDRRYLFSQIEKIEEAQAWPFTYIRLLFKNNKKRNIMPLDNQKDFVGIIQSRLHKS